MRSSANMSIKALALGALFLAYAAVITDATKKCPGADLCCATDLFGCRSVGDCDKGSASETLSAEQCGSQAGGKRCPNNLCCSNFGYCGSSADYCGNGCQSGPCSRFGQI